MRRILFGVVFAGSAVACAGDLTSGTPLPVDGGGVSITATLGGRATTFDTVAVRIANQSADTAYVSRCGNEPLVPAQQFINGQWTGGIESILCIMSVEPGPVRIAPGAHVDFLRFFGTGRYRLIVSASPAVDLSNSTSAVSNVFDVP